MLALLDTSEDLAKCEAELRSGGASITVGQLLTPLTRFRNRAIAEGRKFAIDNGAFARFSPMQFRGLLMREQPNREQCLFVAVPDVVGSARRTLEVFDVWQWDASLRGWPLALVCQDGQEDLPIPWESIAAVFIGGSTEWKLSSHAEACIKAAKALGKWVHVGRVNSPQRFDRFAELGVDSIDGTGISRYSHMRREMGANGLFGTKDAAA